MESVLQDVVREIVLGGGSSAGAVALVLYLHKRLSNDAERKSLEHLESIRNQLTKLVMLNERVISPGIENMGREIEELRRDIIRGGGR